MTSGSAPELLLGNADGSFGGGSASPPVGSASHQTAGGATVEVLDLNGDGNADLATVDRSDHAVVFLGKGDGTFGTGAAVDIRPYAMSDAVFRDVDGDGYRDLYMAPGVELQRFTAVTVICEPPGFLSPTRETTCDVPSKQSWRYYGPSLDVGGQLVTSRRLTVGGAVGLQYRFATENVDSNTRSSAWSLTNGGGIRPCFRLTVGWAFF